MKNIKFVVICWALLSFSIVCGMESEGDLDHSVVRKTWITHTLVSRLNEIERVPEGGGQKMAVPGPSQMNVRSSSPKIRVSMFGIPIDSSEMFNYYFGTLGIGEFESFNVTIKNIGVATLSLTGLSIQGEDSSDFSIVSPSITNLSPGMQITVEVIFSPLSNGAKEASFWINSNDSTNSPIGINLFGQGESLPEIVVEQPIGNSLIGGSFGFETIDFGTVPISLNMEKSFTVKNTGSADLTGIIALIDSLQTVNDFTVVTQPATSVPPGGATSFTVRFTPTTSGIRTATIFLQNSDEDENPFDIRLTGSGSALPDIAIEQPEGIEFGSGTSISTFGKVFLDSQEVRTFTVRNRGSASLTGIAASISGSNASDFAVTSAPPTSLAAGVSATFTVRFNPAEIGLRNAILHIVSNDGDENPFIIPLIGTGAVGPLYPMVSAGGNHSLFLDADGSVWASGDNSSGQLGDGSTTNRALPVEIMSGVKKISAGGNHHSLLLKNDESVWATGDNGSGEFGDGTWNSQLTPIQVLTNVLKISAGSNHSLFLKTDGTAWASGDNGYGLGDGTSNGRITPVQIMSNVKSISSGWAHNLYLKADGTAWASGLNFDGQLGDGTKLNLRLSPVQVMTGVQAISAGSNYSLFLKNDGSVWAVGNNYSGQLGDGTQMSKASPVQVMSGVQAISAGNEHSLFLKVDGSVWGSGSNFNGQLGIGSVEDFRASPVQIASGIKSVSAGGSHSLFVKTDGSAWAAGGNEDGRLGDGTTQTRSIPILVFDLAGIDPGVRWQQDHFGEESENPDIAGWDADPDHDGIANLLERAFNMNPVEADRTVHTGGNGTSGLPRIFNSGTRENPLLSIEFIRLKTMSNSDVIYTPQFSNDLSDSSSSGWVDWTGIETVVSIDSEWERVIVNDSTNSSSDTRFGRIRVSVP
jgi:alpha-tubulin suppressor-like RCC1 family protein